jgi:hypothetical protein
MADWRGVPAETLAHTRVAEYDPGTPLGWHRDVPNVARIFGVSLGDEATLRFWPFPYAPGMQFQVGQHDGRQRVLEMAALRGADTIAAVVDYFSGFASVRMIKRPRRRWG